MVTDDEDTMMPMKLTSEKVNGTEISCGRSAAPGVFAREAKSGAFVTSVAMLLMQDMRLETMAHERSLPWRVEGCRMMGPTPLAFTMHQIKNVIPAVGATIDLTVKRWRLGGIVSARAWPRDVQATDI
jgi:hypothetical protein